MEGGERWRGGDASESRRKSAAGFRLRQLGCQNDAPQMMIPHCSNHQPGCERYELLAWMANAKRAFRVENHTPISEATCHSSRSCIKRDWLQKRRGPKGHHQPCAGQVEGWFMRWCRWSSAAKSPYLHLANNVLIKRPLPAEIRRPWL